MKKLLKWLARSIAVGATFPAAVLAGFGRFPSAFSFFAQLFALAPGVPGSYLRVAYYYMTLRHCDLNSHIGLGSYFSHSHAWVGRDVGIGGFCVIGHVRLGARTQIASGVQIPSGNRQHTRAADGRLSDDGREFRTVVVGEDCWIGAGAILLADVSDQVTVAAGAVVTKESAPGAILAGNPARPLQKDAG